jgi:large subunit ribosomal protein L21
MYAIIEAGGKQFKISEGDVIRVDVPMERGKEIKIDRVLAVVDEAKTVVGNPYIENAEVRAEVLDSGKSKKVLIFKQRPRKGHRKLRGHRQPYSSIKIKELKIGG